MEFGKIPHYNKRDVNCIRQADRI